MADLGSVFDPNDVEGGGFDLIPAGTSATMVVIKTTATYKDNGGNKLDEKDAAYAAAIHLRAEVKLLDGPYAGRFIFSGINVKHPKPDVQKWGGIDMACAFTATNNPPSSDSSVLHDIPFLGFVKMKLNKDTGEEGNEVNWRRCKPINAAPAAQSSVRQAQPVQQRQTPPAQQPPAQTQQAQATNMPWKNKRTA